MADIRYTVFMSDEPSGRQSHTPGPWSVPHFAKPRVNCSCGYVLTGGLMGAVCTVHASGKGDWAKTGDNPPFEEARANAYLISAAPEMFDALLTIIAHMENGEETDWVYARDIARAAVRKARPITSERSPKRKSDGSSPHD